MQAISAAAAGSLLFVGMGAMAAPPSFSDQTLEAGLAAATHALPEKYWGPGAGALESLGAFMGGGAVGDFDNDGDQDLLYLSGGAAPDRLYINDGTGIFTDEAAAWGVDRTHVGSGAAVADVNRDGWLDIYVTSMGMPDNLGPGHNLLYLNTGNGTFEEVAEARGLHMLGDKQGDGMGATFGDIDLDGDLDLFVAGYLHLALDDNFSNRLFRNDGTGTFTDITDTVTGLESGLGALFAFSPRFVDTTEDDYPDLLIAADFLQVAGSRYMLNVTPFDDPGFLFTNLTPQSGTGLDDNGMGSAVADFNRDGILDWYVTSIYQPGNPDQSGNKLYVGGPLDGAWPLIYRTYTEMAEETGTQDGGWGWGTEAVDVNHDGLVDIIETNGWATGPEYMNERMYLYLNETTADGPLQFTDTALAAGLVHDGQGRGLLHVDADGDGDQDVFVFTNKGPLTFYRNDIAGPDTNWLRVVLDAGNDGAVPPQGIGARVTITTGGVEQLVPIMAGSAFLTQSEVVAHFGVGASAVIDEVHVRWPDGVETMQTNVAANQTLVIARTVAADLNGDGCVNAADLAQVLDAWGVCEGCPTDLNGDGLVNSADLAAVLDAWTLGCS